MDTRRRLCQLLGFTSVASIVFLVLQPRVPLLPNRPALSTSAHAAANATLGFGAVIAVSHARSPRRSSLLYAANLTDFDVTIPEQPAWTDDHVARFRSKEQSMIKKGSALAWLGHLNALKWFLSTRHQTALILEDDVDWSIHLRRSQIPLAAAAIRSLLHNATHTKRRSHHRKPWSDYWAPPDNWELLMLGHCRDFFPVDSFSERPLVVYNDPTVPPLSQVDPELREFLEDLGVPPFTRLLHRSYWPLCTFAYAVTRASAQRILDNYSTEGEGGCIAYDVRILEGCRDNDWKCYTVNPELFHHVRAPSLIADVNHGVTEYGTNQPSVEGKTTNIVCGARDPRWFSEDRQRVEELKRAVRKGHCVVDDGIDGLGVEDP